MYAKYRSQANFVTIYVKEAHPEDGWQVKPNKKDNVCYLQPKTLEQRRAIARDFIKRFDFKIPLLIDGIDDRANKLYAAWPERLYVVDEKGVIAYKGGIGPFEYKPDEVEAWLAKRFGT